jgi:hypothetical protein
MIATGPVARAFFGSIRAAAGLFSAALLAGCDMSPESVVGHRDPAFRYRLTALVDTPQGLRTGSSVIQIQWSSGGRAWGPMQGGSITQKGDAVMVDLPNGRKLFVLLTAQDNYDWPGWSLQSVYRGAAADPTGVPHTIRLLPRKDKNVSGEMVDNWPYFVTFDDPKIAMSIRRVDPDNLAATFGKGYAMKGLTVQLTDAPITRGIERTLPWVAALGGAIDKTHPNVAIKDASMAELATKASFSREQ